MAAVVLHYEPSFLDKSKDLEQRIEAIALSSAPNSLKNFIKGMPISTEEQQFQKEFLELALQNLQKRLMDLGTATNTFTSIVGGPADLWPGGMSGNMWDEYRYATQTFLRELFALKEMHLVEIEWILRGAGKINENWVDYSTIKPKLIEDVVAMCDLIDKAREELFNEKAKTEKRKKK